MADIFLSYASRDRFRAREIASLLEESGWSVWMDRYIEGGTAWNPRLDEELANARCVIVLWTRDSVKSEWVQREAQAARERDVLLPVLLHPVVPPSDLAKIQAVPATAWIDGTNVYELRPLIERVAGMLGAEAPQFPATSPVHVTNERLTRVEIVEAAFEFCAARLDFFHQRKSPDGPTNEVMRAMEATYERLAAVLYPISSDDLHALLAKHEAAYKPRDEED